MVSFNNSFTPFVLDNHISVKVASIYSGYSVQYLRRLLRNTKLSGIKLGQIWFIDKSALDKYINTALNSTDKRYGAHANVNS